MVLLFLGKDLKAQQLNMPNYENRKRLRFGFTLALTSNDFKFRTADNFLAIDTLQNVGLTRFPGFVLGGIVDYKLSKHWHIRTHPSLALAQRNVRYTFTNEKFNREVEITSTYLELPILLKYRTRRFGNYGFYVVAGGMYSYDIGSDIDANRSLADPVVAVYPSTFSYEMGFGFEIYFPYFKFSPEIKITNSIHNVLVKDGFVFTEAFDGFWSRIINFSFHFE